MLRNQAITLAAQAWEYGVPGAAVAALDTIRRMESAGVYTGNAIQGVKSWLGHAATRGDAVGQEARQVLAQLG